MEKEERTNNERLSKSAGVSKCSVDNIRVKEEGDDSDDDIDYVPSIKEELEADKETNYNKSLEENVDTVEKNVLDDKKVKEIDDLWEKMKQQQYGLTFLPTIETNTKSSEAKLNSSIKSTATGINTNESKKLPTKRKRTSNMDDIIKRHTIAKRESTLVKSKKLWQIYRDEQNIGDDLDIQSKNSHIEKTSFLNQTKYNEWKRAQQYRLKDMLKKQHK